MKFGLSLQTINLIIGVFQQHDEITHVQVFGSRVLGNYKHNSDIDLVIRDKINDDLLASIIQELDDLPLPYLFDVKCYSALSHPGLKEHIDRFAKDIYIRF